MPNGKSVRVQCLRCGHFSVLTPDVLSRLAIAPNTPIAAFVKASVAASVEVSACLQPVYVRSNRRELRDVATPILHRHEEKRWSEGLLARQEAGNGIIAIKKGGRSRPRFASHSRGVVNEPADSPLLSYLCSRQVRIQRPAPH